MRIGEMLWLLIAFFLVAAACGVLTLLIWWLWRKITLPEGAPPPKWTDLSGLKSGAGRFSIVVRLVVVGFLGLLMSAPIGMIYDLIRERSGSYQDVVRELSRSWGGQQLLIGPILSIPYTVKYTVTEQVPLTEMERYELAQAGDPRTTKAVAREVTQDRTAILLPEELRINGRLEPELRQRGIYSVRVYTAALKLTGVFKKPDFKTLDDRLHQVHWDRARLLVNLSDTKAFRDISPLRLGGGEYKFVPGTKGSPVAPTGFSTEVDLSGAEELPFAFDMAVGGSQGFFLAPVAVSSTVDLQSAWPHPKYCGDGLPSRRQQSDRGFEAVWEVPNLVRNYPQFADLDELSSPAKSSSRDDEYHRSDDGPSRGGLQLAEYIIGVDFFEPVFHYSILTRAVKYAMMFIALTFLSVLIFEISTKREGGARLHLAQYGLIGLGLCLFYLVLLAASEQMPFVWAYLLAAAVNILMIGGYVWAALKQIRAALLVTGILTALYAALFFILRMEEYALVSGTSLLVLAMIALMHATRNLGRPGQDEDDTHQDFPPNGVG